MNALNLPVTVRRVKSQIVVYEKGNLITFMTTTALPRKEQLDGAEEMETTIRAVVCMEDGRFIAVPITYVRYDTRTERPGVSAEATAAAS